MENVWIANIVTSATVGGLLWFSFRRYVTQQDERHKELDKKVNDCDERSDKIESNYIKRFDDVKDTISDEIKELTKSINESEKESIKEMTKLHGKVENIQSDFNQIKRVLK